MTPEERFTRIENLLQTMTEQQFAAQDHRIRHDREVSELRDMHKGMVIAIGNTNDKIDRVAEAHHATEQSLRALIQTVDRILGKGDGL